MLSPLVKWESQGTQKLQNLPNGPIQEVSAISGWSAVFLKRHSCGSVRFYIMLGTIYVVHYVLDPDKRVQNGQSCNPYEAGSLVGVRNSKPGDR